MDFAAYFKTQSPFTDPGDFAGMLDGLPKDAAGLCGVVQGVCLDYRERYKYPIVNERLLETHSRLVSAVLKCIASRGNAPLTQARGIPDRLLASSSDFANLFVCLARHVGLPARKRVGFDGFKSWELAEVYDGAAWKQVDPSGVMEGKFVPAAEAWKKCRAGEWDAEKFQGAQSRGMDVLRCNLMLDLAAQMKIELLNWDRYGWMLRPFEDFSDKAWETLDKAAGLLLADDLDALRELYDREEGVQVPRVVKCDTPLVPPHKAELPL